MSVLGAIWQRVQDVLIDLPRSREAETALLLESVVTDIGVSDCRSVARFRNERATTQTHGKPRK